MGIEEKLERAEDVLDEHLINLRRIERRLGRTQKSDPKRPALIQQKQEAVEAQKKARDHVKSLRRQLHSGSKELPTKDEELRKILDKLYDCLTAEVTDMIEPPEEEIVAFLDYWEAHRG